MADFGGNMPKSLALPLVDAPGKDSWPIAGYTYLLVYMDQQDCAKGAKVVSFIKWGLSDGTKYATELDYVPLPDNVKQQVLAKLDEITCQGKPASNSRSILSSVLRVPPHLTEHATRFKGGHLDQTGSIQNSRRPNGARARTRRRAVSRAGDWHGVVGARARSRHRL
jgi:hypothetical protein